MSGKSFRFLISFFQIHIFLHTNTHIWCRRCSVVDVCEVIRSAWRKKNPTTVRPNVFIVSLFPHIHQEIFVYIHITICCVLFIMHNIANNPMEIYLNTKGKPRSRCPSPQLPTTSYHNNHHHHHQSSREIAWHQIREDYIHDSHIAGSKKLSFGLRRYVAWCFFSFITNSFAWPPV